MEAGEEFEAGKIGTLRKYELLKKSFKDQKAQCQQHCCPECDVCSI